MPKMNDAHVILNKRNQIWKSGNQFIKSSIYTTEGRMVDDAYSTVQMQ